MPGAGRGDEARTWLACALMKELDAFAGRRADVTVIDFDAACEDPSHVLARASEAAGLRWDPASATMIAALNRPGEAWDVDRDTARVPGQWRRRLDPGEVAEIEAGLDRYGADAPRTRDDRT
jgi:hypothetical protein